MLEANQHRLLASEINPGELLSMTNALPFMDDYRLIVVEGLLGVTESQSRGRRRNSSTQSSAVAQWQPLEETIPQMPQTTILIFIDGSIAANNPMLRILDL